MLSLLWLLLPVAALSGWYAAKRSSKDCADATIPGDYIKGLNFLLNEQPDKAIEVFIRLVEVESDTVETHLVLGNLFRKRGEVERAIRIHQNLIARPNLEYGLKVYALLELGRDYLKAGLLDRAETLFKEVIALDNKNVEAHQHLLELYEQEKDWQNALDTATSLQNHSSESLNHVIAHYYCELGEADLLAGKQDVAGQLARKALSQDRNCARASMLLGDIAFQRADFKTAIKNYGNVHSQEPELFALIVPQLRRAFEGRNDPKGYLRLLQKVVQKNSNVSSVLELIETLVAREDIQGVQAIFENEFKSSRVPLELIREYVELLIEQGGNDSVDNMQNIITALDGHLNNMPSHVCSRCGFEAKGFFWQCPGCRSWGMIKPFNQQLSTLKKKTQYRFGEEVINND